MRKGVILDGFPRTTVQAEALDTLLCETGQKINAAISLKVDDAEMVTRISDRYTCGGCGEGYHDNFKPTAKTDTCDKCGSTDMKRRADDNAETVGQRLEAYHAQTAPLTTYYDGKGALKNVDAMGDIARISKDLATLVASAIGKWQREWRRKGQIPVAFKGNGTKSENANMADNSSNNAYWAANVRIIRWSLVIWVVVSFGYGILLRPMLSGNSIGGTDLDFWFAQQGSIIVFWAIIFFNAWKMNKLDAEHGVEEQ